MKTKIKRELRAIAKITSLFGIQGEVKIFSYARAAEEFEHLSTVYCGIDESDTIECTIESVRTRGDGIYLKLVQYSNRTEAEQLREKYLFVEESQRKQPPTKKFYIDDLLGCVVVNESGKKIGVITSVDALPSQMIYTVHTGKGSVMLPAVEEFVRSVDVVNKKIVVRPPEGLFEGKML